MCNCDSTADSERLTGFQRPWNLVVDGDSNTATSWSPDSWWEQLRARLAGTPVTVGANFAVAGNQWSDLAARQNAVNAAANTALNCLVLACGTNDIVIGGATSAAALVSAQTYLSKVASAYQRVVLLHLPPVSNNVTFNTRINEINAGASSLQRVDIVVSRANVAELSSSLNSDYFADAVHYNIAGWRVLTELVYRTLAVNL